MTHDEFRMLGMRRQLEIISNFGSYIEIKKKKDYHIKTYSINNMSFYVDVYHDAKTKKVIRIISFTW